MPKSRKEQKTDSSWTTGNHLVGTVQVRSILGPTTENDEIFYSASESIKADCFQVENPRERKPSLWRGFLCRGDRPALAIDSVAVDWQQTDSPEFPTKHNLGNVTERLQGLILERIYGDILPNLVLKAALEEVRAHYLKVATSEPKQGGQRSSKANANTQQQAPPLYYSKHPNTYLKPPETGGQEPAANSLIQFTPTSLVNRIKAGCALAWSIIEEHRQPLIGLGGGASAASMRRSSSRIARISEQKGQDQEPSNNKDDARYFWGVIPGGTIASYLLDEVWEKAQQQKASSKGAGESGEESGDGSYRDEGNGETFDEGETDEIDITKLKNPYMQPSEHAILEWLGRKTAKLLSSSDLQQVFPHLMIQQQQKGKKKKKAGPSGTTGRIADSLLTSVDRQIWANVVSPFPEDASACFFLDSPAHEDTYEVDQWETSYFSRAQFALRVHSEKVRNGATLNKTGDILRIEKEYKERKAWETIRYKSIHSGFTIWPSWEEAVAELHKKENVSSNEIDAEKNSDDAEMELAKATLAEDESKQRGGRRTRRGGDGVFYGNQSGLNPKQLGEALLRIVSLQSFSTVHKLLERVPDESTDPMRRMRSALGRLVWKRNQMACLKASTELTDLPLWKSISKRHMVSAKGASDHSEEEVKELICYLAELNQTELQLRHLVLTHLTDIPVSIIACAGDERPGAMDSADQTSFEDLGSIEWKNAGHEYIGKNIFRPPFQYAGETISQCGWFRITGFVPSVTLDPEDVDAAQDKPQIGTAKDNRTVECRARFHAVPVSWANSNDGEPPPDGLRLVLTEAQVAAGLKAAEIQNTETANRSFHDHPFSGDIGAKIEIIPEDEDSSTGQINGTVVGWESAYDENGDIKHEVLVLPQNGHRREDAFWATLDSSDDNCLMCTIEHSEELFIVRQFDYHESSEAFKECRAMIGYLQRHSKAAPFLKPVDPIALNIPQYFEIIRHPMDISTVENKLEKGDYSNIHPKDAKGATPVSRMLNGPFREDVELIFDNAMAFNPPDDWIYQAAGILKKYFLKKIEQASAAADESVSNVRSRPVRGAYMEYDSDVDMYNYGDDKDEDYDNSRQRKRKQPSSGPSGAEDTSSRPIERSVKLQKLLGDGQGLGGPLANVAINSNANSFSLFRDWSCRRFRENGKESEKKHAVSGIDDELSELIARRAQAEEKEAIGTRRSTRSHLDIRDGRNEINGQQSSFIFDHRLLEKLDFLGVERPRNRLEVELCRELLHEHYFAKLYHTHSKNIVPDDEDMTGSGEGLGFGMFIDECFPPFLGRITPVASPAYKGNVTWEIRSPNIIPAIRWVIRGLISSVHVAEIEPLTADSLQSGVILPNNAYFVNPRSDPFDVLHQKEINRRKRTNKEGAESSEEEVELSEYEKLRAERVARNADFLKSLGLS